MKRRTLLQLLGGSAATALAPAMAWSKNAEPVIPDLSATGYIPAEPEGASLNVGWRFNPGDVVAPPLKEQSASYVAAKAGGARGAAGSTFNDGRWRTVDLPHDWAIESPPSADENIAQGYRKRGIGWYRRAITLDPSLADRYLEIQFGAISTNAQVWFNGTPVAHNWSGYNGFNIDITSMATFGGKPNILAVRVDADAAEGWWYEGAGIYRDVRLVDRASVSIITDGVHADPRRQPDGKWRIPVNVTIYSIEKVGAAIDLKVELLDRDEAVVATARSKGRSVPLGCSNIEAEMRDITPELWSVDAPNLYSVRTSLIREGKTIEVRTTPCGFRSLRFDADKGFFLNDQPLKIKGVCLHQDHAGVGVAVPPALVDWRVRQIKAMGSNAIRCSHGAPDASLLEACDRHGILVMNENRNFNVSPDYIEQLEWLVRRDRNHPSVFMWSVFNEEPLQGTPAGYEMVRRAVAVVKALDDSRPVTAALSNGMFTPVNVSQAVDVVGFNYQNASYDKFHATNPTVPMISSEDTSAFITRGAWATDKAARVASSDDTYHAGWGLSHREGWKVIDTRPYLAGGFVWTAFDYHGEPTPFKWPANSSYFGILDLCGFKKSAFYIRRALWVKDRPLLDILPHWNWQGREGQVIKVMLATNLDRVELRLNGKLVGERQPDPYEMITFDVPFRSGVLEARGWKAGKMVASAKVETTGAPVRLALSADRPWLTGDGIDAQPLKIEAVDSKGVAVPVAELDIELSIEGGQIIGVGNGDPVSTAPSKGNTVRLFNGLAQVIVQSQRGGTGVMKVMASSNGVESATCTIDIRAGKVRESLPASYRLGLQSWRQSPVMAERPASIPELADNDMNSWAQVIAGDAPATVSGNGWVIMTSRLTLTEEMTKRGATIRFGGIAGAGDIYMNGKVVTQKASRIVAPVDVAVPVGSTELVVGVILKCADGEAVGLPEPVFVDA
jgi:beta-galactosidase